MFIREIAKLAINQTGLRDIVVRFRHLGITEKDWFIGSYPKSGSTWMAALLSTLIWKDVASFEELVTWIPGLDKRNKHGRILPGGGKIFKTHEPYSKKYSRGVYLVRDGRDIAVSYYYHLLRTNQFRGSMDQFLVKYFDGTLDGYGTWIEHVTSWIKARDEGRNIAVLRYEDLLEKPKEMLVTVCDYFELGADENDIDYALNENSKEKMKKREISSGIEILQDKSGLGLSFVRKGIAGEWKNVFNEDHLEKYKRQIYEIDEILKSL